MITNYYTLIHIANELDHLFSRRAVDELFTQHRGELVITWKEIPAVILVGCDPANNFIYARKSFARARRNSTDLFPDVPGAIIEKIFMHPADRQMSLRLQDTRELVVQLFGSKANVLLLDARGTIAETFLKKSDLTISGNERLQTEINVTAPKFLSSADADQPLTTALKRALPLFGPVLVKELLTRAGLDGDQPVHTFLEDEIGRLPEAVTRMKGELLAPPSPRIYYDGTLPVRFSIIPLNHLSDFICQSFPSLSEAIQTYRAQVHQEKNALHEKETLVQVLERERVHREHTLHKIAEEAEKPNRADQYELFGKLLIAQLHLLKKGDITALAEDFISGSNTLVEIPLDPHLTPSKNAERYFERAEKSRHAMMEQQHRIAELARQQKSISVLLSRLDELSTEADVKQFEEGNEKALSQFGWKAENPRQGKKEGQLPFRVFTVAGGFQVWAGKSGENNDLLSTRHTAKNDLWFHARGVGGSHVVLKIGTGKGEVSKQAIEQAAAIAAYYSKMKKSKLVPVTMCEGKYVRKPKGAPAGTVTVEREKTIFTEPALPPAQ
jgi:predicted ribosome quality control (RQC) complex YloA/Tae2 family protein